MACLAEVKVFDISSLQVWPFQCSSLNNAQDLVLQISNATGIPKEKQLLLCKGRCLLSLSPGSFQDVIQNDKVYLFEKDYEALPKYSDSEVDIAELPPSHVDNFSLNCALLSHCVRRKAKSHHNIQEYLKEGEFLLRSFLQQDLKNASKLLQHYIMIVTERIKRIETMLWLVNECGCSSKNVSLHMKDVYDQYLQVREKLRSDEHNLTTMVNQIRDSKEFKGCQENCCERFQRSVSMVEQSHKRLSSLSEVQDPDDMKKEKTHLEKRCRAVSQHFNTECQMKQLELVQDIHSEVSLLLKLHSRAEEIKAGMRDFSNEDPDLEKIHQKCANEVDSYVNRYRTDQQHANDQSLPRTSETTSQEEDLNSGGTDENVANETRDTKL